MTPWVLIRGLTREAAHWGDFPAMLSRALGGAPVIALDLPGAGRRRHQRCPTRIADMVDTLRADLRSELRWPGATGATAQVAPAAPAAPVALLGLSMGGMVAASWAQGHPEEVERLVMVNASARPINPTWQRLRPACWPALVDIVLRRDPRRIEQAVLQLTSAEPQRLQSVVDEWAQIRRLRPVSRGNALRQLAAAARCRIRAAPAKPLLLLASANDRLVHPDCSRRLAAAWSAPLRIHASAGHDLALDAGPWLAQQVAAWTLDAI